jgi:phosphoribosylformimino-5-aminoimidazole carboxamide ribotide isomerase
LIRVSILPVIDLLGGVVVRGVAGKRSEYRAIESCFTEDASPSGIARALVRSFGFSDVYVADLDAIARRQPAWGDYESIARAGLKLWVDAGTSEIGRAKQLATALVHGESIFRIILGLESLASPGVLREIASVVDADRLVFSLDLKDGQALASRQWPADPLAIAEIAVAAGIGRIIVLDLARVGVGEGTGTQSLCEELHARWPELELVGGGGVRSMSDVHKLLASGLSRVLVASALHDGKIARN